MANSYQLVRSDGTNDIVVDEKTTVFAHGLIFTGRRIDDYGEDRNTNSLHMLENFASVDAGGGNPDISVISAPLIGQLWFNTTVNEIRVYTGTWDLLSTDDFIVSDSGPYVVDNVTDSVDLDKILSGVGVITLDNIATFDNLNDHINDLNILTTSHTALAIDFDDTNVVFVATELQTAIEELSDLLDAHILDLLDAHDASAITNVPSGSISSTDVQSVLEELEDEIDVLQTDVTSGETALTDHINDPSNAHPGSGGFPDATPISYDNSLSGLAAVNVEEAITELEGNITAVANIGTLGIVRVKLGSAQVIAGSTPTKLTLDTVLFDTTSGSQYEFLSSRYRADFDQEVRARAYVRIETVQDGRVLTVQIRKNFAVPTAGNGGRQFSHHNQADSADVDLTVEGSALIQLSTNDTLEVWVEQTSGGNRDVDIDAFDTGFEIEVLRDLTP